MSQKSKSPVLKTLGAIAGVFQAIGDEVVRLEGDPDERLLTLESDPVRLQAVARALNGTETVMVPNLSTRTQVAVVIESIGLLGLMVNLSPDFAKYGFLRDERGKVYQVLTWQPGQSVSSDTVLDYFDDIGYHGNTAAFLEWIKKDRGQGVFASIPDGGRCFRDGAVGLCAPCFDRTGSPPELYLRRLDSDWYDGTVFVGFREVQTS
jgi:hypothetical protein